MGVGLLTLSGFERLSKLGLNEALIQRKESDIDPHLNTAWVMKIGRGMAIATVAFLVAPYVAGFFNEPRATDIIRVISLSPVVLALQNPGVVYLQKDLQFHKQFVYKITSSVISLVVMLGFAFAYRSVWALVFGYIAGDVTKLVASYIVHEYRPQLEFKRDVAVELYGYGKWLTVSGFLVYLITEGDDAFVGWFLGAGALGYYQIAYRFSNAPATEITQIVSSVVFPTYSQIQTDVAALREMYFKTLKLTVLISAPVGVGIIAVAPVFTQAFFGQEWTPMVKAMRVLGIYGLSRSIGATWGPLFNAMDRPDIGTRLQVTSFLFLAVFIYPATLMWDLAGVAAVLVGLTLLTPISIYLSLKIIDGSVRRFVHTLGFPLLGAAAMGALVMTIDANLALSSDILEFSILVLSGVILYTLVMLVIEFVFDYGVFELVKVINDTVSS